MNFTGPIKNEKNGAVVYYAKGDAIDVEVWTWGKRPPLILNNRAINMDGPYREELQSVNAFVEMLNYQRSVDEDAVPPAC